MPVALRSFALLGLILTLLSLPLFARMPNPLNNPLLKELHEASHALLFFGVGGILLLLVKWRTHWGPLRCLVTVVPLCIALGAAIEWIQPALGRHRTWLDMERNALGVIAAGGVFLAFQSGITWRRRIGAAALAIAALIWSGNQVFPWLKAQYLRNKQFPVIMDFDYSALLPYVENVAGGKVRVEPAPGPWMGGQGNSAKVLMPGKAQWPGIRIFSPYPDWSGYRRMKFDIFFEGPPADIAINIYTAQRGRKPWAYKQFQLRDGSNRLKVDLPHSEKAASVTDFLVYSKTANRDITIFVDNLRLE